MIFVLKEDKGVHREGAQTKEGKEGEMKEEKGKGMKRQTSRESRTSDKTPSRRNSIAIKTIK